MQGSSLIMRNVLILFNFYKCMENKTVGWLVLGISVIIMLIILLFNQAMLTIVEQGCPIEHTTGVCPAYGTIRDQTYLAFAISGVLVVVGFVLLFSKPAEKIVVRHIKDKPKQRTIDTSEFTADEKRVLQSDIVEKTGFAKVKITRILDKFESVGIIERKRRGMQNLVVLQ